MRMRRTSLLVERPGMDRNDEKEVPEMASQDLYPGFDPPDVRHEADVFGTWFARLGAIALMLGAAFGFKYAVDEGIIGPSARVLLGIGLGLGMLAAGEVTFRKDWSRLSQAVSGGGVAVLYLSVWAAFGRYGLIGPPEAFTGLALVAFAGGFLALRYDAMALAVLSTVGGLANPLFLGGGFEHPIGILAYIVVIDLAVVGLGYFRGWRALDHLALWGTWILFAFYVGGNELEEGLFGSGNPANDGPFAFATIFFVLFTSLPVIRRAAGAKTSNDASDLMLMVVNALAYTTMAYFLLSDEGDIAGIAHEQWQGPTMLLASGVYAAAGLFLRIRKPDDPLMAPASFGFSLAFLAAWAPVELEPSLVPAAWALQGALCLGLARSRVWTGIRLPGLALSAMSVVYLLGLSGRADFYDVPSVIVSATSFAMVAQIVALGVSAWTLVDAQEDWARATGHALAIATGMLTMLWLTMEVLAYFHRIHPGTAGEQGLQFALTAVWGLYATALLIAGIVTRSLGARVFGIVVFGITLFKLLFQDVWMLDTLYRTVVFLGMGAALLACSVMYHRLKDMVTEGH
jgi:uncharacterized membrane protein